MTMQTNESGWTVLPRIRLLSQPMGLGAILAAAGGVLCRYMILALNPEEGWVLTLCTILMAAAFFLMFAIGVYCLLMPLHRIWVSPEKIQLRLGKLVLRSIEVRNIRSITSEVKKVLVRNREQSLYRIKFYCYNAPSYDRPVWLDWSVEAEEALKTILTDSSFLF